MIGDMLLRRIMPERHKVLFLVIYVVARLVLGVAPILLLGVVLSPVMSIVLYVVVLAGVIGLARLLGWYESDSAASTGPVVHPVHQMAAAPTPPAPMPAVVPPPSTAPAPSSIHAPTTPLAPTTAPMLTRPAPTAMSVANLAPSRLVRRLDEPLFPRWSAPRVPTF